MVNMRERAALVEVTLRLDSAPGKGTKIQVLVPIKESPALAAGVAQQEGPKRSAQLTPHSVTNARSNLKIGK
jgi:hypothetical protein